MKIEVHRLDVVWLRDMKFVVEMTVPCSQKELINRISEKVAEKCEIVHEFGIGESTKILRQRVVNGSAATSYSTADGFHFPLMPMDERSFQILNEEELRDLG